MGGNRGKKKIQRVYWGRDEEKENLKNGYGSGLYGGRKKYCGKKKKKVRG